MLFFVQSHDLNALPTEAPEVGGVGIQNLDVSLRSGGTLLETDTASTHGGWATACGSGVCDHGTGDRETQCAGPSGTGRDPSHHECYR